jgi:hypothetical protein
MTQEIEKKTGILAKINDLYEASKSIRELEEQVVSTLFEQYDLANFNTDGQLVFFREGVKAEGKLLFRRIFMANFYKFVSYKDNSTNKDDGLHGWYILRGRLCRINYEGDSVWLPRGVDPHFILEIIRDYYGRTPAKAPDRPKDMYIGPTEQKILDDLKFWIERRALLSKKGVQSKRVYLLNGPPGTGKSRIISYLKQTMGMEYVDLDMMSVFGMNDKKINIKKGGDVSEDDSGSAEKLKGLNLDNKLVVIEDIHLLFEKKKDGNTEEIKHKVRLDQFNNFLSGNLTPPNCIVFITSNDRDVLPPVLFRPGRVDVEITYTPFDEDGLKFIAKNFLETDERVKEALTGYLNDPEFQKSEFYKTPAEFTKYCTDMYKKLIEAGETIK